MTGSTTGSTTRSTSGTPLLLGVPKPRVAAALAAYVAVVVGALALRAMPSERAAFVSLAFVAFTAAALYFNLKRAAEYRDSRLGWQLVSLSAIVAIVFELWLAAEAVAPARVSIPPVAWLVQTVAANGTLALGVLLLPYGARTVRHRLRMGADAVAFFLASLLVFWVLGARNEVADSTVAIVTRVEAVVSYGFNALELGIVIYIGSRAMQRFRGPLGWFLLAFSVLTVGTAVVMFGRVRGAETVGSAGELLQLLAFPCFVLAPMARVPARLEWVDEASLAGDLLTYGPVLAAMLIALPASFASGGSDLVLAIGVPLLASVLLFRQFLAVRDVRELSRTLELRVEDRTSALRRTEQALAQAQKLEAVGRVAGSVAHDFNNVLQAIQLAAQSIEQTDATQGIHEEVAIIRDAARSGSSLAREIIEFSRPNVDATELADVAETLRSLEWIRHQLNQRRIEYDVRMPARGLQVRLGATRLEQVLSNLITNARDAVHDGGRIAVSADRAWVDEGQTSATLGLASGAYVRLSVSDNGAGISDDVLPRLFEPFFTTKTASQGTGLGLATAYSLVRRAGGTVTVTSRVGAGATFEVMLPVAD